MKFMFLIIFTISLNFSKKNFKRRKLTIKHLKEKPCKQMKYYLLCKNRKLVTLGSIKVKKPSYPKTRLPAIKIDTPRAPYPLVFANPEK